MLASLKPILHVLQAATTYLSDENNVSVSAVLPIVYDLTKSMEITEDDPPAIQQVKCNISQEVKRKWHLDDLDVINPGSKLIATCLDPGLRQTSLVYLTWPIKLHPAVPLQIEYR